MTNPNPIAAMIVELMAKGNARGLPMERSPELGQYLREAHGYGLPSERRPGGLEAPNVREFPEQNLGTGGVRFDSEGWPIGSGGWAQRADANAAQDRGARGMGIQEALQRIGMRSGLDVNAYRQVLNGLPDEEIRAMAAQMGYGGVDDIGFLRGVMSTDFSIYGKY